MDSSVLQKTIEQAKHAPFYKEKLSQIAPVHSLDDFQEIPFTSKEELRSLESPFALLACDEKHVIQVNTTSGTTGKPSFSFFSHSDLKEGSAELVKAWKAFGVSSQSRVNFIMSYGLFSGASLNTYALQHLGAFVIPAGIRPLSKQLQVIEDFKPDTLAATPSFYIYLYNTLEEKGESDYFNRWSVKRGIAAGEIYTEETRKYIEERLGITIYDHYGLCELYSGFAHECSCRKGLHVLEGLVYGEIIDPETGKVLPDGEYGELVVTSIHKNATPIVRYRTGDITCRWPTSKMCRCASASNSRFMIDRICHRRDDIFFVKGIKIDPHMLRDFLIRKYADKLYPDVKIGLSKHTDFYDPDIYVTLKPNVPESLLSKIRDELKRETFLTFVVYNKPHNFFKRDSRNKADLIMYKEE